MDENPGLCENCHQFFPQDQLEFSDKLGCTACPDCRDPDKPEQLNVYFYVHGEEPADPFPGTEWTVPMPNMPTANTGGFTDAKQLASDIRWFLTQYLPFLQKYRKVGPDGISGVDLNQMIQDQYEE